MLSGLRRAGSAKRSFEGAPRSERRVGYRYLAFEAPSWSVCLKQLSLHMLLVLLFLLQLQLLLLVLREGGDPKPCGLQKPTVLLSPKSATARWVSHVQSIFRVAQGLPAATGMRHGDQ